MDKRGDRRQDRRRHERGHELGTFQDAQRQKRERDRRDQARPQQQKQKAGGGERTRCEHCGGPLRACGAVGHAGHLRWKCRRCGRTVWVRPAFKPPVPIVPASRAGRLGG